MASVVSASRVDSLNVGLLFVAFAAAIVLPFEVFLFSYAVLGPLHYLTEISWLHEKQYYVKGKYDVLLLVGLSLILTVGFFMTQDAGGARWIADNIGFDRYARLEAHLIFVGLMAAAFFAFVKQIELKLMGIGLAVALTVLSSKMIVLLGVFLPTLIHVFVFTSLFMLYGALKSRSQMGYVAVALHLVLALALLFVIPSGGAVQATSYGFDAYSEGFAGLNRAIFQFDYFASKSYTGLTEELGKPREALGFTDLIFRSDEGIAIMRFIAFAYTYHYLNWFSKTEIIRWHQVPLGRFIAVVFGALASIALYAIDYSLGFKWLFLLSFMHVMLEFPLNWVSATGIVGELRNRLSPTSDPEPEPEPAAV